MIGVGAPRLIRFLVFGSLAGCGDQRVASVLDARQAADAPSPPDAPLPFACEAYPIPWPADPAAHATAALELADLSAGATMTWNDNTGTLSTIFQLDHTLSGCTDGQDVNAQVIALLTAHPAVFQLDASEWRIPEPFDCRFVPADLQILNMGRTRLANHPLARDVFAYSVKRVGGDVVLTSVIATYVPPAITGLDEAMTACSDLDTAAAEAAVRATALPARTFDQCAPTGDILYAPHPADEIAVVPGEVWSWEEAAGQVRLAGTRTLRITVDPSNYTPELLASDARCPVPDPTSNDFTVGFEITLDLHTGAILFIKPGLDCIVC